MPLSASTPLVSVVIPAWNAERTLAYAIDSVLAQTFGDFEIVVCNDASTDGTAALVEAYDDPRVRLVQNAVNSGEGATRDHAIRAARGAWIAVLDADDAWEPTRLSTLLSAAGDDRDVMVFDNLMVCHDAGAGMVPWRPLRADRAFDRAWPAPADLPFPEFVVADRLLIKPMIPADWIARHEIGHSDRKFGADTEYFCRLAATGLRFRYVHAPLYLYRATLASMTAKAGPGAMRDCIAACAGFEGFDAASRAAIARKLTILQDNDALHAAWRDASTGHPLRAASRLLRHPRALAMLPQRALRRLHYRLHARWHDAGGR